MSKMEAEIQVMRYHGLKVKCPLLMINENHTYIACVACRESAMCGVSRESGERKPSYSQEVQCSPTNIPSIIDRSLLNLYSL
jgi:hypothetical protein